MGTCRANTVMLHHFVFLCAIDAHAADSNEVSQRVLLFAPVPSRKCLQTRTTNDGLEFGQEFDPVCKQIVRPNTGGERIYDSSRDRLEDHEVRVTDSRE
jgi:hypothetical protein